MNTKTAGRDIAFLALCHISQSEKSDPDKLILAATRTLRDFTKQRIKQVQQELRKLGEFFFSETLLVKESKYVLDLEVIHSQVAKLEEAAFSLQDSLDLPELLNHSKEAFEFASQLVDVYRKNKEQVNNLIAEVLDSKKHQNDAKGWKIDRVLSVDRTILKVGTTELLFFRETAGVVVIDEALKLGEKYSSDESAKFINGVLADVMNKLAKQEISGDSFAVSQVAETPVVETTPKEQALTEEISNFDLKLSESSQTF